MIDFCLALVALVVLSPLLLMIVGAIAMKGNPFFAQLRPGKNGKIFKLVKFRTMTCEKDKEGKMLPDEKRLTKYGRFLRSISLDELPELWNVLKGDMAIVGSRPLLVSYLDRYNDHQARRHEVRSGFTGVAQIGTNVIIGTGSVVMAGTIINTCTVIGAHCIINTGAVVEHDNFIEDYVHISPKAVLGGTVRIGEKTHIGIGTSVKNNIDICKDCILGAGAVVIKNIENSGTFVGVPAKMIE